MNEIEITPTCVPEHAGDVLQYGGKAGEMGSAIHLDIDDGIFTPEYSWPYIQNVEKEVRAGEIDVNMFRGIKFDVHLMVSDCRAVGENFIHAGARSIIAHVESNDMNTETLDVWRALGVKEIGLALLIDTPLANLNPLLPLCNFIHVMSVAIIGAQGAPFDDRSLERIRVLHENHPDFPIQVDGGVSRENIAELVEAGARRFAVGSAITTASSPAQAYAELVSLAQAAL